MTNPNFNIKQNKMYDLGIYLGYFFAFLLFSSMFYFIMTFLNKIPQSVKYYHVLFFVITMYAVGFAVLRFRK